MWLAATAVAAAAVATADAEADGASLAADAAPPAAYAPPPPPANKWQTGQWQEQAHLSRTSPGRQAHAGCTAGNAHRCVAHYSRQCTQVCGTLRQHEYWCLLAVLMTVHLLHRHLLLSLTSYIPTAIWHMHTILTWQRSNVCQHPVGMPLES